MPTDNNLANLARRDWLTDGPLNGVVTTHIEALRNQRYADRTIRIYLGCLAHFSFWIKAEPVESPSVDASLVKRFLVKHLPICACPMPCYGSVASSGAALRHLLRMLPCNRPTTAATDPVAIELERFASYLTSVCGVAPATCDRRVQDVGAFLVRTFGAQPPVLAQVSVAQLDAFFAERSAHLRPASLRGVCNSLRSYFRYRALLGETTAGLAAALPRNAD